MNTHLSDVLLRRISAVLASAVILVSLSGGQWNEKLVHLFGAGRDGSYPNYGLTLDQAGNLYVTTPVGGSAGQGIVFRLTP